jgi:hypothetical protein
VTVSFFEVLPLVSSALLTMLHPLPKNVLQTICHKLQEDSGTGGFLSRSSLFMVGKAQNSHGVRSGLYDRCYNGVSPSTFSKPNTEFNSDLTQCDFWTFPTMRREI